jgi:hypothetical protein
MNRYFAALIVATALLVPAASTASVEEDERWISRYVADNKRLAARTPVNGTSRRVEFAQLSGMRGQEVRVVMSDGRSRRGRVERADSRTLTLRVVLPSGYARLRLSPSQIQYISQE